MTGEAIFKRQLYQCMLAQTLILKSDIETRHLLLEIRPWISWEAISELVWDIGLATQ